MQDIEFRGRTDSGKWIFGGATSDKKYIFVGMLLISVDPETVGQFIGACDCDGKKIFEDDVIILPFNPISKRAVIQYNSSDAAFYPCLVKDDFNSCVCFADLSKTEVIGNIHDDSELLEDAK